MELLEKLARENYLNHGETVKLLEQMDEEGDNKLFHLAQRTKEKYFGSKVLIRGLLEFSNYCRKNCLYCGLRHGNILLERYRFSPAQILETCYRGAEQGFKTLVLQSGEDQYYSDEVLAAVIEKMKAEFPEIAISLSIGERSYESYKILKEEGAHRFLLKHETADPKLFEALHPDTQQGNRNRCLENLEDLDYQVGTGFLVGLPRQGVEELARDFQFIKKTDPDMLAVGPFIPHPHTPLAGEKGGSLQESLRMVALSRLFLPQALIPATSALGNLHTQGRMMALKRGANVLMINLTPREFHSQYQIYRRKEWNEGMNLREVLAKSSLEPDMSRGDSIKKRRIKGVYR